MCSNRVIGCAHCACSHPVAYKTGSAKGWRIEHASQQGANNAAHTMHTENIQGVVRAEHFLQGVHAPQAGKAASQANDQCATNAHIATGRGDRYQAGHGARGCTQHRGLAAHQRLTHAPGQHRRCGRHQGVDEGQCGKAIGL